MHCTFLLQQEVVGWLILFHSLVLLHLASVEVMCFVLDGRRNSLFSEISENLGLAERMHGLVGSRVRDQ